jgi:hypothetical protein
MAWMGSLPVRTVSEKQKAIRKDGFKCFNMAASIPLLREHKLTD